MHGEDPPAILYQYKVRKAKADRRVPSLQAVMETIKEAGIVAPVYHLMLQSGLRLRHAIYLINNIEKLNIVKLSGYYRVDLNIERGMKRAWVAYVLSIPPKTSITDTYVRHYAKRLKVKPKYVRKFAITKMHEAGIEDSIVRFITGHSEQSPHDVSYYDKLAKADREYAKYAAWLRENVYSKIAEGGG